MRIFDFKKMEPIIKGWSKDKKYCVADKDGTKYLLRKNSKVARSS